MRPLDVHRLLPLRSVLKNKLLWITSNFQSSNFYYGFVQPEFNYVPSVEEWLYIVALEIVHVSTDARQAKAYTKAFLNLDEHLVFFLKCERMRGLWVATTHVPTFPERLSWKSFSSLPMFWRHMRYLACVSQSYTIKTLPCSLELNSQHYSHLPVCVCVCLSFWCAD